MSANLFGTDGIRGKIGKEPLTLESITLLGKAIAMWAQERYGNNPTILIGHDTRESCSFVKAALKSGLLLHSVNTYDAHVLPTPAIFNIIHREACFNFGVVISASHNPYLDNGIKLIDAAHGKLGLDDELALSRIYVEQRDRHQSATYTSLGHDISWPEAATRYITNILEHFDSTLLKGRTVVLDCANGATSNVAPKIFEALGARVIPIHNFPTGININNRCGSVHPHDLQRTVLKHNADIGIGFDGDGDRVVLVNPQAKVKDGDDVLALLSNHPKYKKQEAVVGTIMTNQGLDAFLQSNNKQLIRSSVGDKFVAEALEQEKLLLGGEQSGHIIANDYLSIGDGIFAALRVIEVIQETNNWDLKSFEKFPQVTINIPVQEKKDLNSPGIAHIIATGKAQLNGGRLVVRYSGTEPILRVMVEEKTHDEAHHICTHLSKALQQELS